MSRLWTVLSGARVALLLIGLALVTWFLVWGRPIVSSSLHNVVALVVIGIAAAFPLVSWWCLVRQIWKGYVPERAPYLTVLLGGFMAATISMYLAGSEYLGIWFALGLGTMALTLAALADLAIRVGAPQRGTIRQQLGRPISWLGALATFLVVGVLGGGLWLGVVSQRQSSTATPPTELPAMPSNLTGEVAWTLTINDRVKDHAAGTRGPVIAVDDAVIGLDPSDGSELWRRQYPHSSLRRFYGRSDDTFDSDLPIVYPEYLIPSPDHRYIVVRASSGEYSGSPTIVEAIDTQTGQVTITRLAPEWPDVQVTNQAMWLDTEVITFNDGTTTPAPRNTISGVAAPTHFFKKIKCHDSMHMDCTVTTMKDSDFTQTAVYEGVVDVRDYRTPAPRGWLVQRTPDSPAPTKAHPEIPMQAVSVETGEIIPLGEFKSIHVESETWLKLYRTDGSKTIFDAATGTTTDIETDSSVQVWLDNKAWWIDWDGRNSHGLRRMLLNGTTPIEFDLPPGQDSSTMIERPLLWVAPGCVMAQGYSKGNDNSGIVQEKTTYLACIR